MCVLSNCCKAMENTWFKTFKGLNRLTLNTDLRFCGLAYWYKYRCGTIGTIVTFYYVVLGITARNSAAS